MSIRLEDPHIDYLFERYQIAKCMEDTATERMHAFQGLAEAERGKRDAAFSTAFAIRQALRVLHPDLSENEFDRSVKINTRESS